MKPNPSTGYFCPIRAHLYDLIRQCKRFLLRNRAHQLDHPKEAERCPYEGMVIDVYGYCRFLFLGILSELRFFILAGIRPTTLAGIGFGEYLCMQLVWGHKKC